MPEKISTSLILSFILFCFVSNPFSGHGYEGISRYYIRYDVKSTLHRIAGDNLLMIPADDEFRAENFSVVRISGAISAADTNASHSLEDRIRQDALKKILVEKGLKSVKTKDMETIISYEGAIISPVAIRKKAYDPNTFVSYEASVRFSPISFPDRWESLGFKHRIKGMISNFFNLFK